MKKELIEAPLIASLEMVDKKTPGYVYVVFAHAEMFVVSLWNNKEDSVSITELRRLIGQPQGIAPRAFALNAQFPEKVDVMRHLENMFNSIETIPDSLKRSRWYGFAAGAAIGIDLRQDYYVAKEGLNWTSERVRNWARDTDHPLHWMSHVTVGYLQGWLWARGHASIDDFRIMNNPDAKPTAA